MTDEHDYFDKDEATDEIITLSPDAFMLNLEFLPDPNGPLARRCIGG
jgi:hypothetical protein